MPPRSPPRSTCSNGTTSWRCTSRAPDEATHNHDLEHKIYSIERLSADVVAPVTEALRAAGEDFRLLLLSDHTTYMANGAHGADPVPFVLYDSRVSEGSGLPYSEANGAKGPYVDDGRAAHGSAL